MSPSHARFVPPKAAAAKASDDASTESTSTDKASDPSSKSPEMYDNLAKIFLNPQGEDWLGLLASSEQWPQLKDGFFARLKVRAAEEEDPEMLRVSRVLRLLQGTSDRVMQHAALLEEVPSNQRTRTCGREWSRADARSSPPSSSSSSDSSSRRSSAPTPPRGHVILTARGQDRHRG